MSTPPMTGGSGGSGSRGGTRKRDITAHFIRFGVKLVYERADQGMKSLSNSWKKLVDSFKRTPSVTRDASKGLDELGKQAAKTTQQVNGKVSESTAGIMNLVGATGMFSDVYRSFFGELARSGSIFSALSAGVSGTVTSIEKLAARIGKDVPDAIKIVEKDITGMLELLGRWRGLLTIGTTILAGWFALARAASNVYDTFVDINSLLTYNRRDLEDMAFSMNRTAAGMFASAEEMRSVVGAAFELGIRGSKSIEEFSAKAYKMGRVLGIADSESANLLRNFQMMKFSQDEVDRTTIAMRLLQERTALTSREMLGVVEQSRILSKQFAPGNRAGFTEGLLKMAAQFKAAKMDVNESIQKMGSFLDVTNKGASKFAAIMAGRMGMSIADFRKQIKDGTLKMEDMSDAAQGLMDQFGDMPEVLDRITGGNAAWIAQLADGKKAMMEQQKALDDLARSMGTDKKTLDGYFKSYLDATNSMGTAWGRFKTIMGYFFAALGTPVFRVAAKGLNLLSDVLEKTFATFNKVYDAVGNFLPEWAKLTLVIAPLVAGLGLVVVVGAKLLLFLGRLGMSLVGLGGWLGTAAKATSTVGTAFSGLAKPIVDLVAGGGRVIGWLTKFVGLGPAAAKVAQVIAAAFGGIGTAAMGLLGVLGKLLGPLGWILTAGQLLDPKGAREKDAGQTLGGAARTVGFYTAAGAAIGSVVPGAGTVTGAVVGGTVGLGVAAYNAMPSSSQTMSLPQTEMDMGGPQSPMTSNASMVPARTVSLERPESPVRSIRQEDVVNAINDQTRALLMALKELGGIIAQPSALEAARARFGGNTDVFDRVAGLEVR